MKYVTIIRSERVPLIERIPHNPDAVHIQTPLRARRLVTPANDERPILAALLDWKGLLIVGVLIGTAIFMFGAVG